MIDKKYGLYGQITDNTMGEFYCTADYYPVDFLSYWSRCSLLANFYTDFCHQSMDIMQEDPSLHGVVSTILNELLENALKYTDTINTKIELKMAGFFHIIRFKVSNYITRRTYERLSSRIDTYYKLIESGTTIEELYFSHLESKTEDDTTSQLGYLMMMKDYPVQFGFNLLEIEDDKFKFSVEAYIRLKSNKGTEDV